MNQTVYMPIALPGLRFPQGLKLKPKEQIAMTPTDYEHMHRLYDTINVARARSGALLMDANTFVTHILAHAYPNKTVAFLHMAWDDAITWREKNPDSEAQRLQDAKAALQTALANIKAIAL